MDELYILGCLLLVFALVVAPVLAVIGFNRSTAARQEIARLRQRIEAQAAESGWESLHAQLREIDPVAALRIHPNDPQRLSRALEVFFISGKTLTELTQISGESLP